MPEFDRTHRDEPFPTGAAVAIVEMLDDKVWTHRPVTVLRDQPDEIALWLAPGTITRYPTGPQHGEHTVQQWLNGSWNLQDKTWGPPGKLRLSRPGDAFDVWMSPTTSGGPRQPWYINLQDPLQRVNGGFVTIDHVLDILVAPDLTSWEWKDEAEFAYAETAGLFTAARAARIREIGVGVIDQIEAGTPPWDTAWANWTPPT